MACAIMLTMTSYGGGTQKKYLTNKTKGPIEVHLFTRLDKMKSSKIKHSVKLDVDKSAWIKYGSNNHPYVAILSIDFLASGVEVILKAKKRGSTIDNLLNTNQQLVRQALPIITGNPWAPTDIN
jgi:hypothetical protein